MAGIWYVIVPQKTELTNLITNPSFEVDTTGWAGALVGDTIALSSDPTGPHGYWRAYLSTSPVDGAGVYTTASLVDGTTYTFSIDFKASGAAGVGLTYEMYFATAAGVLEGTKHTFVCASSTYWQRESVTWACDSTATHRLYVVNDASHSEIFNIDGALCVASASDITYFDGNTANCRWTGTAHASTSVSEAWARNVGVVTDLLDYNLRVLSIDGVGSPNTAHQVSQYASMPGAEYKGHKVLPRYITLTNAVYGTSLENLHSKRKSMVSLFSHDTVAGDQPITLRYTGANSSRPIDITCYLDQEVGSFDQPKVQRNAIRLACYDPYFYDILEYADNISSSGSGSTATRRYFICKRNGSWTAITPSAVTDPGSGIQVRSIALAGSYYAPRRGPTQYKGEKPPLVLTNERIYVGGHFLNWNGTAASDYIAYYDLGTSAWSAVEAGTDGNVYTVAIAPNGYVYAGGIFTQIGATAANRIAYWDGAAWNAMGTGFPGAADYCSDIVIGNDGQVYACGKSDGIGGVADANNVGRWDGAAWNAMATGVDNTGMAIEKDEAGNIYVGGVFTGNLQKWNGSSWTSLAAPANVYRVKVAPNGYIYVGMSGGEFIMYWNGQAWVSMGGGITAASFVLGMDIDANGLLWVGGTFTAVAGLTVNGLACWNGYAWVHPEIELPASSTVYAVTCNGNDIYLGFNTTGSAKIPVEETITNSGTARAYPELKIARPSGTTSTNLRCLRNETTNTALYFDYDIQLGETLYMDFDERNRSITSSYYGDVWRALLRGSKFGDFYLVPGDNRIAIFSVHDYADGLAPSAIKFTPRHESIDGPAA